RSAPGSLVLPGNHLPQVSGKGAGKALLQCRGIGRRPAFLPGRTSDPGAADRRLAAPVEVGAAPSRAGLWCCGLGLLAAGSMVLVLCGGSASASALRGEVSAVRRAPQRGAALRVAGPR